jgi:hypothetical protein
MVRTGIIRDLYRGLHDFKNSYQLKTCLVKSEKGDLRADPHSILYSWKKNHFCQLLNVCGVNDVRQTEVHIAESQVPESSVLNVEMAVENRKGNISSAVDNTTNCSNF